MTKSQQPSTLRVVDDERGMGLLFSLFALLILAAVGASIVVSASTDLVISDNYRSNRVSFHGADYGINQTLMDLRIGGAWVDDMFVPNQLPVTMQSPFPSSFTINGYTVTMDESGGAGVPGWYPLGGALNAGEANFQRQIYLPPTDIIQANSKGSQYWAVIPVRTTGASIGTAEPSVTNLKADAYVRVGLGGSAWDNALFAKDGQNGLMVNGNVQVRGSIHILGDPNNPTTLEWGGTSFVMNSYENGDDNQNWDVDFTKIPALLDWEWNGDILTTLDAIVRIRDAVIDMDGTSFWGLPDVAGNAYKETIDYLAHHTPLEDIDAHGNAEINTDEYGPYDDGDQQWPDIYTDLYTDHYGTEYTYYDYYYNSPEVLVFPDTAADGTALNNTIDRDTPAFTATSGDGWSSINWDPATQTLEIQGVVRVNGDLHLADKHERVNYRGTGMFYATNDMYLHGDVMPAGPYLQTYIDGSFNGAPRMDSLGLAAEHTVEMATGPGESWIKLMAGVYSYDQITVEKQSRIAGALVTGFYDFGQNVPRIYHVPSIVWNLPPGMPGADPGWGVTGAQQRNWFHLR